MLEQKVYELVPWVLGLATIGALVLSLYTWARRQQAGTSWLALTLFTGALWTAFDLFNYVVDLPAIEVIVKCATWPLILMAGVSFFRFACIHARREHWWELARVPVMVAIVINLLLMVTNPYHHLLWPGERWLTFGDAHVPWLESGPAFFWIFRNTACALPLAGMLALVISAVGSPSVYARQIAALVTGALIPIFVNLFLVSPTAPGVDLTPIAVVGSVSLFALSTFRFGLLDVMPVARSLLLAQLDDGVIVLDPALRVVDLNPAAERLLGLQHGWTPGRPAEQMLPFWGSVKQLIETSDGQPMETTLGGESGAVLELTSSIVHGEDGASRGRLIVAHDITARAQLVRELDAYAQTVARDLKNPLASVIDAIDAFRQRGERVSDTSSLYLQNAERVCGQMTATVDALLRFAQLRTLDEVDVEAIDMANIVDSALRRLSAAIAESHAEIERGNRWPAAVSHPVWVEEIWTNYISNAIKYGGQPPHVELGASEEGDRMVRYWVRDNGPGLSEEQRRQLFTEFTRLDPKRSEGHGLGLSIVQRIAEKLGGGVGCSSTMGQGSTFWFTLPT
ncbi:MAG: PAS domain-containing protein [Deltaproteobacteria bacterium]|nr:PAS domain-containing protein [Deltaproteobacteria bacterium]MBI3388741.1 PAS domain-containing protein [Deltaproteobacteria bacterium]